MSDDPRHELGSSAETLAVEYLSQNGYRILDRNFRCRQGEIDIIAQDGAVLCIVEVRSVRTAAHGDPLETVGSRKRSRIIRAASLYVQQHAPRDGSWQEIRFDVLGIICEPEVAITLVKGAFEASSPWH